MSSAIALVLGLATVALAFTPLLILAVVAPAGWRSLSLRILCVGVWSHLVLRIGTWAFVTVHLRAWVLVGLAIAAIVAAARMRPAREWIVPYVVLLLSLVGLDAAALSATCYRERPIEARMPLGTGTYCVLQGGNSRLTNPFHGFHLERAALDIVELTAWGNRARTLWPHALADYASFGASVVSPCDGRIRAAQAELPDTAPGHPDDSHSSGNYVVVQCVDGLVKLAHLRQGSLRITTGARVNAGQAIADIGNSGGSSEPHLHIGAFAEGTPLDVILEHSGDVPIRLDDRYLVANDVIRVN